MTINALSHLYREDLDADRLHEDEEVDAILQGAVDLHVHPSPSPFPRRIGILDAARDAAEQGFSAIVVKSHHASMQTDVLALHDAGLADVGIHVFSGIALNRTIGGLNPYAVELHLALGAKVVWFPTISSQAHIDFHHVHHNSRFPTTNLGLREHEPISILGEHGELVPEVHDIFDVIKNHDAILNAGHLTADEIDVLVRGAHDAGVSSIVVSHPTFIIGASPERCGEWVGLGAKVEHCLALAVGRAESPLTHEAILPYLEACGPDGTIFSSDLGQANSILPVTGFRRMVRRMLDEGYAASDIRTMVGTNGRQLLGLDAPA
ncbi:DUF6282 family protein [Microbacterium terregens]|uniref:DUF6282 family protein n=1 Tax=Microbacterium terregens TaxID=69363 RepID=A0ABV5T3I2_9MICO